jgi:hypothetical protein
MNNQTCGTLYVLSNVDQSLAKVGRTRNGTPDTRADDYSRQHGIAWHVYWSARTCNVAAAEAAAHRDLQDRRFSLVPEALEIFHVTPAVAARIAARYVVAPDTDTDVTSRTSPIRRPGWVDTAASVLPLVLSGFPAGRRVLHWQRLLRALLH